MTPTNDDPTLHAVRAERDQLRRALVAVMEACYLRGWTSDRFAEICGLTPTEFCDLLQIPEESDRKWICPKCQRRTESAYGQCDDCVNERNRNDPAKPTLWQFQERECEHGKVATNALGNLTNEEEEVLLDYLAYIRSKKAK